MSGSLETSFLKPTPCHLRFAENEEVRVILSRMVLFEDSTYTWTVSSHQNEQVLNPISVLNEFVDYFDMCESLFMAHTSS